MLQKLLILTFLTGTVLAQNQTLPCILGFVNGKCSCSFEIYNPDGFNNYTIVGNPIENCNFEDVEQAFGTGLSSNIPVAICNKFQNLETLVMENMEIKNLNGNTFRSCTKLKNLHLSRNEIEIVPDNAFSATVLENLALNDNKLRDFGNYSFFELGGLKSLNISSNKNRMYLPETVFDPLTSLENLYASSCTIDTLKPLWFANLRNLRGLDLSLNLFMEIPARTFNSLVNLTWIDLSLNELSEIRVDTFENNVNLFALNLAGTEIEILPSNLFANQNSLYSLILSNNNKLSEIPSDVFHPLTSLRILDMEDCNIQEIDSAWLSTTTNLVRINLSSNNITSIPENIFTSSDELESIVLSKNKITKLDSRSFGSLEKLSNLDVQDNKIAEVDHYLMSQSTLLKNVNFLNNECANFATNNFFANRASHMDKMKECFDKFDRNPIELSTFNSTIYEWYSIRSNDGWDALQVTVKAYENVHIALTDSLNGHDPLIEIQIGQNRNRVSHILDESEVVFRDETRGRLNEIQDRTFIIGWRFGIVMVFSEGSQFPFMAYAKRNAFSVNFFGLRSLIEDSDFEAKWEVTRIQDSSRSAVRKIYGDIEAKMRRGVPVDLKLYLIQNKMRNY